MATNKTFKIGERALGGKVRVQINGQLIRIAFVCEATSKDLATGSTVSDHKNAYRMIMKFLEDNLDHYNSEKIADFIVSKSKVEKKLFWE